MKTLHLLIVSGALLLSAAVVSAPGILKWRSDSEKTLAEHPFIIRSSGRWGDNVEVKWEMLKTNVVKPAGTRFQPAANVVHLSAVISNFGGSAVRIQKLNCVGKYKGFDLFNLPVFAETAGSPLVIKPGASVTLTATGDVAEGLVHKPELIDTLDSAIVCTPEGVVVDYSYRQKLLSGEKGTP